MIGTPAFMAPEQARGFNRKIDPSTDVFGLGGILCNMLTGKPPYVASSNEDTRELAAEAQLDDARERLAKCGAAPELIELCEHCLAKNKADRPANGEAVAMIVAELRLDLEAKARMMELQQARRLVLRLAAGSLAAVLVVGIIGTTIGMLNARTARDQANVAREQADSARDAERKSAREATDQRRIAETNLDVIQDLTVDLTDASEKLLPYVPQSNRIRRKLTQKAVQTFEILAAQRPESMEIRRWLGVFTLYQGNIERLLGNCDAAETCCDRALHQLQNSGLNEELLLMTHRDHAEALILQGKLEQAKVKFDLALEQAAQLQKSRGDTIAILRHQAWCLLGNAHIAYRRCDFKKCLKHLDAAEQGIKIIWGLPSSKQQIYDPLLKLESLRWRIAALREDHRSHETEKLIEDGKQLMAGWTHGKDSRIPSDDRNAFQLMFELAAIETDCERHPARSQAKLEKECAAVVQIAENLHQRNSDVPGYRDLLAEGYLRRSMILRSRNPIGARFESIKAVICYDHLKRTFPNNAHYLAAWGRANCELATLLPDPERFRLGVAALKDAATRVNEDKWFGIWLKRLTEPNPPAQ